MDYEAVDKRRPNLFEQILLFFGIIVVGLGYFFVHMVMLKEGIFSADATIAFLIWIGLIFIVILTAVSENSKEELKIIIFQQHEEMKLLRQDLRRKR